MPRMGKKNKEVGTSNRSGDDPVNDRHLYAITRLKAAGNAWLWRVTFRRRGKPQYKSFYDLKLGGSAQALAAAKAWRDRQLARTSILTWREFHAQRRSNNTSGVSGVYFKKSGAGPLGAWQAYIKLPNGKRLAKNFAILKYGREQAFRLAQDACAHMLTLIDDQPYLHDETAKLFAARRARSARRP